MQVLTEELLIERSKQAIYAIFSVAEQTLSDLIKEINEIENASLEVQEQIRFMIACGLLFHAEQFFRENVIQDQDTAENFIKRLRSTFEAVAEASPSEYLSLFQSSRNPVEFLGLWTIQYLKIEDALLQFDIAKIYSSFLLHGFTDSLNRAWGYSMSNHGIATDLGL